MHAILNLGRHTCECMLTDIDSSPVINVRHTMALPSTAACIPQIQLVPTACTESFCLDVRKQYDLLHIMSIEFIIIEKFLCLTTNASACQLHSTLYLIIIDIIWSKV